MKKNRQLITVPTLFTALNLFCGFLSVIQAANGRFVNAGWLIFIAGVFDALDGRIARASGRSSEFGLQMDSLGDVISSGLAPSILCYQVHLYSLGQIGLVLSFLPTMFAAFRLARFNIFTQKSGKKNDFTGMPAPMAATMLASTVIFYMYTEWSFLLRVLIVLVPIVSLLMASGIRYDGFPRFSLKEKGKNRYKLIVFFTTVFFLFIAPEIVLFLFMLLYLLSGPIKIIISLFRNEDSDIAIFPDEDQHIPNN
jgi:CDP-diacylglycerol--serine O-phosphatidyltransferase